MEKSREKEQPITITADEARQADRSVTSMQVLLISLVLVIAAFALIYFGFYYRGWTGGLAR